MAAVALALAMFNLASTTAYAQSTAFTYQGQLSNGANPAAGRFDLRFALYDAATAGAQQGSLLTNAATAITNGLFTVTLDFGNQFPGAARWLEIGVRSNGVATAFTTLAPRQPLTPAPYAIFAATANGLSAGLTIQNNNNVSGAPNVVVGSASNYVAGGVIGATISGGGATNDGGFAQGNTITANFGTIGGGERNSVTGQFSTVGGGFDNIDSSDTGTLGGGQNNIVSGAHATMGGGFENNSSGTLAFLGGGFENTASGQYSTVSGGYTNTASGTGSFLGGGYQNTASSDDSTLSGGLRNNASGVNSTVSGGLNNTASGYAATVPGGGYNLAAGQYSFAAGENAQALYSGDFVWSDQESTPFAATAGNQFAVRASGGVLLAADVQMGTNSADYHNFALGGGNSTGYLYGSYLKWNDGVHLGYNYYADASGSGRFANGHGGSSRISAGYSDIVLAVGDINTPPSTVRVDASLTGVTVYGTFNNSSDRNAKQDFAPVSPAAILEKVLRLPVSEWSYKEDAGTRHIGPMGQDFYTTFNIGTDEKHIAPIDEGGIAFAAIQGLNQKLESRNEKAETQMEQLAAENAELKEKILSLETRLEKLERLQAKYHEP